MNRLNQGGGIIEWQLGMLPKMNRTPLHCPHAPGRKRVVRQSALAVVGRRASTSARWARPREIESCADGVGLQFFENANRTI
jgi:hypothetical protein